MSIWRFIYSFEREKKKQKKTSKQTNKNENKFKASDLDYFIMCITFLKLFNKKISNDVSMKINFFRTTSEKRIKDSCMVKFDSSLELFWRGHFYVRPISHEPS